MATANQSSFRAMSAVPRRMRCWRRLWLRRRRGKPIPHLECRLTIQCGSKPDAKHGVPTRDVFCRDGMFAVRDDNRTILSKYITNRKVQKSAEQMSEGWSDSR